MNHQGDRSGIRTREKVPGRQIAVLAGREFEIVCEGRVDRNLFCVWPRALFVPVLDDPYTIDVFSSF